MKRFALFAILLFPLLMLGFWCYWGFARGRAMKNNSVNQTVESRLQQYGLPARARLKPSFNAAGVFYPPERLVLVGLKSEKVLQVYAAGTNQNSRFIRSYPVLAASGAAGPKLLEGDRQVPEGIYGIESLNPNSKYHLALRLNYPNQFDREQGRQDGRADLGGDIMLHGNNVSIGCLAMGDEAAEDLFVLAADTGISRIAVILSPVDFRKGATVPGGDKLPRWTEGLYQSIKGKLSELPVSEAK